MKKNLKLEDVKVLHQNGDYTKAKEGYLALLNENPKNIQALHWLGILYAEEGDLKAAENYISEAIRYAPNDATLLLHYANILKAKSLYPKAIEILLNTIERYPDFAAAYNNLGTIYFIQKNWQAAIDAYQVAIRLQPNYIDAYYNLGLAYQKANRLDEAINAYQALLALAPDHPPSQFQLGCILMQKQDYVAAIQLFSKIEKDYQYHFETQSNLATCYLRLGKIKEAKKYYNHALQINSSDMQILFNLAIISMRLNEVEAAIKYYFKIIEIEPDNYSAHNNLAVYFLANKDANQALYHFKEVLRIQPNNDTVRHTIDIILGNKKIETSPPMYITELFDSYADHYDSHLIKTLHYQVPNLLFQSFKNINWLKPKSTILDLGCGTGLCGEIFKPVANLLVGIDLSKNMLEIAENKHIYDKLVESDILSFLKAETNQFDIVLAGDVIVYFGRLEEIFASTTQILAKNGLFIFNIERSAKNDFEFTSSGRFAHHPTYIERLAAKNNLKILQTTQALMRLEAKSEVSGSVYVLQKLTSKCESH